MWLRHKGRAKTTVPEKLHWSPALPPMLAMEDLMEAAATESFSRGVEQRKHFKQSAAEDNRDKAINKSSASDSIYPKFPSKVKYETDDLTAVVGNLFLKTTL